ncbi:MAG TPA: hypothetical protein EYP35_05575 [Desulfobacterales bacterium]|nr:hypothetical protein [Desulfobacterales bacterium]HIP40672.1 hypothetical protein [Desulfocapsa sulfexigens]
MKTTKTIEQSKNRAETQTDVNAEISKVSVTAIAISAGIIGIWATASLFAGLISSGGPAGLINNLITAIIG